MACLSSGRIPLASRHPGQGHPARARQYQPMDTQPGPDSTQSGQARLPVPRQGQARLPVPSQAMLPAPVRRGQPYPVRLAIRTQTRLTVPKLGYPPMYLLLYTHPGPTTCTHSCTPTCSLSPPVCTTHLPARRRSYGTYRTRNVHQAHSV